MSVQVDTLGRTLSGSFVNWIAGETLKPSGGGWSAPVMNDSKSPKPTCKTSPEPSSRSITRPTVPCKRLSVQKVRQAIPKQGHYLMHNL